MFTAHRLRTIADSDMIVVIHAGKVIEVGKPHELLQDKSSSFYSLVLESNEFNEIFDIAVNSNKTG